MARFIEGRLSLPVLILAVLGMVGCWSEQRPSDTPTPVPTAEVAPVIARAVAAPCTYAAALARPTVSDIVVRPLDDFQVAWNLRNTGACRWTNVALILVSPGETSGRSRLSVPSTAASNTVNLVFDLTAPRTPGSYTLRWNLQSPDGAFFGPSLSIGVTVEAYPPATPQSPYGVMTEIGCILDAEFVEDVTVPDGTVVQPGDTIQKIWRVRNTGACDWHGGTHLASQPGNALDTPAVVAVPPTRAGATAEVMVDLTAPARNGRYTGWWRLQSPDGTPFGVGLYATIQVGGASLPGAASDQSASSGYIHNISYHSREIFLAGQSQGNRANVFSKVGDSLTDVWAFLNPIGDSVYSLGDYDYLQPVINYFSQATARTGNSFNNVSLAAVSGWSSFDVVNPDHVAGTCPGMTPIACEYSVVKPSVAIILIGVNDTTAGFDGGAFAANIAQIVQASIDSGVIPVLSTVPYNEWGDAPAYNQIIISTAVGYDIPWIDFYAATWNLPNHGIEPADGVHPSLPPTNDPTNFTPENLRYGMTVRNLLVLQTLDMLWRQVLSY